MQQSRRMKAQLSKALHPNTLLQSTAGFQRKTKPGDEHSSGRIYCRALNNKLQDYCIIVHFRPYATSTSQAEHLTQIHTMILQQDP